jgi:hypothetical protein
MAEEQSDRRLRLVPAPTDEQQTRLRDAQVTAELALLEAIADAARAAVEDADAAQRARRLARALADVRGERGPAQIPEGGPIRLPVPPPFFPPAPGPPTPPGPPPPLGPERRRPGPPDVWA